jgi:lipoate-protein ligase A
VPAAATTPSTRSPTRRRRTHELAWRLILDDPRGGAANMALDHALALGLDPGEGVVRLYGWSRPTISFGKNEPAVRIQDRPDLEYVRRPTGGRSVLHDDELTYAVVAPVDAFAGLRDAYVCINEALAAAIRSLGPAVDVVRDGGPALGPDAGPCFQAPQRGEIVAAGRKVVGSAQARLEGALLQHGSILLGGDQGPLATGPDHAPPVTLKDLLGPVERHEVTRLTADSLRAALGGAWTEGVYDASELEAAVRLEVERYGSDTWTWRR